MAGDDTPTTRIIERPDGSEALLLRRARLAVVKGPDKGAQLLAELPRVLVGSGGECHLRLTDPAVSRQHLELTATERGYLVRDLGSTNGTTAAGLRLGEALIAAETTLLLGETSLRVGPTDETVEIRLSRRRSFGPLLGQSRAMRQVFATLEEVASSAATLLLEGESGTGKEVAAAAVHEASPRREGPFTVVDCAALPPSIVESELFGHERGAFTGAGEARAGALEGADGGTLFLDEVGELPLELQPRLLRFLESRELKRLGSTQRRPVDVRIVAATNRQLAREVERGAFRGDLFYRLAVVRLELPPLRERPDDILLLARHFAEALGRDADALIGDEVAALLLAYRWPGNLRELRNTVERLALIPAQALDGLRRDATASSAGETAGDAPIGSLAELPFHEARGLWQEQFERQYLATQLERAGGVVARAAARAGLPRQTFHRLARKHGLGSGS
jgi:transcriptional regulator with GAF, ATPase, and Fis domain